MNKVITQDNQNDNQISKSIRSCFTRFHLSSILKVANTYKKNHINEAETFDKRTTGYLLPHTECPVRLGRKLFIQDSKQKGKLPMKYYRSGQYPIEFVLSENINKEFSSHNHANHYIISLCIKGSVAATLENKSLLLKENDFFAVPPFMPHAVSLTDTCVLVSLCMDKSFVEDYSSQKATEIWEMLLLSPQIQKRITKLQTELLLQAVSYVYELHNTHKEKIENDMLILCDKLINHFSDSLPLDNLAKDLYLSKYYLIHKCKRNLGLTPHKFHLQNRIRKAQTLLFTNKSITEASMDTGFYDQSHFDRSFKNIVGISPTEYLASCKIL